MQGKEVDMEKLVRQHELMPAVGNVRVNARGDELGPGGQIVKKREDQVAAYYENNPMARPVAKTAAPVSAPVSAPVEKAVEKAPVVSMFETKIQKNKGDQ